MEKSAPSPETRTHTIADARRMNFADLYALFDAAGFIPPDKAALIASQRVDVEHTFGSLQRPNRLCFALAATSAGNMVLSVGAAHVSRHSPCPTPRGVAGAWFRRAADYGALR